MSSPDSSSRRPLVSVITPSGGRPFCLDLCRIWVRSQDYDGPIEHIVSEDEKLIVPENAVACMDRASGEYIVVFEDDDYYPDDWVSFIVDQLQENTLVGPTMTICYDLPLRRVREIKHIDRASFNSMGWRREVNPWMRSALLSAPDHFGDVWIWRFCNSMPKGTALIDTDRSPISMKRMPGRKNAGMYGQSKLYVKLQKIGMLDDDGDILRSLVGRHVAESVYFPLMRGDWKL